MTTLLVFDGDCGFCTRWAGRAARLPAQPRPVAWQLTDLGALGLTQADAERSVQLVEPGGARSSGARAAARLLELSGPPYAWVGRVMALPGVQRLAQRIYEWVADHRGRLPGGTPACALPAAQREHYRG